VPKTVELCQLCHTDIVGTTGTTGGQTGAHMLTDMTTAPIDTLPPLPSIQQGAAWLGVDPKTVRRYIAQGRIKAKRVGPRLIRIERESLLALASPIGNY